VFRVKCLGFQGFGYGWDLPLGAMMRAPSSASSALARGADMVETRRGRGLRPDDTGEEAGG